MDQSKGNANITRLFHLITGKTANGVLGNFLLSYSLQS